MDLRNLNAYRHNEAAHHQLREACSVLLPFNISSFRYFRVFEDGRYLNLSTNHIWLRERLDIPDNGESMANAMRKATLDKPYYFLWPQNVNDVILEHMKFHKICNGFSLYKRMPDNSVEAWSFGSNPDDLEMQNFYINNLQVLRDFIKYFTSKFPHIIDPKTDRLAKFKASVCITPYEKTVPEKPSLPSFKGRYLVRYEGTEGFLTSREFDTLKLLAQGKTSKEIALDLDISHRTVEGYILKAKRKFAIYRKSELVNLYLTNFMN